MEEDELVLAAAILRSEQGLDQNAIAKHLSISQPKVSRLLDKAVREKGWLIPNPQLTCKDEELLERVRRQLNSSTELKRALLRFAPDNDGLLDVTIVDVVDRVPALLVVDVLRGLLDGLGRVGVTWGRTVRAVTDVLKRSEMRLRRASPIQFVPLCGEPLRDRRNGIEQSSSAIVSELASIFNADRNSLVSIAGVPAFIPLKYKDSERKVIERFVADVAGYAEVFARQPALINSLEAIITSVGVAEEGYRGIFLSERLELGDICEEDLRQFIVGDIGGVILGRAGIPRKKEEMIDRLNDRWLGVKAENLVRCVQSAKRTGGAGVIVFAFGKRRLEVVKRCLHLNLVSRLIVDREFVNGMELSTIHE